MSQHDYDITTVDANTGILFRAAVNAALQALASNNLGATAPPNPYAGMWWPDSANDLLYIRNIANTAWVAIGTISAGLFSVSSNYAADTGSANVLIISLTPAWTSYQTGRPISVKVANTNTGAATIAINGLAARSIKKNISNNLTAGDIQADQIITIVYDGTNFQLASPVANTGFQPALTASVGSNALTVALKNGNGDNPSVTNPVILDFRSATLTNGIPDIRTVSSALSITLPSGGTLGFANSENGRIYVWAIDYSGSVALALSRTADIFQEDSLVSTTNISTSSDSATTMYSTTGRTNVACKCLGYIELTTGSTAGTWSNAPTKIQMMGPGVHRTGDIIQRVRTVITSMAIGSAVTPYDNTAPQNTAGNEYITCTITPTNSCNKLHIKSILHSDCGNGTANNTAIMALFQDNNVSDISTAGGFILGYQAIPLTLEHQMNAATINETTFKIRAGVTATCTLTVNGMNSTAKFNNTMKSFLEVTEVFA